MPLERLFAPDAQAGAAQVLAGIDAFTQRITAKTEFLFVCIKTADGACGWGEGTFNSLNPQVVVALRILREKLVGRNLVQALAQLTEEPAWKHGRAFAVAVSALEQAVLDALARVQEVPLHVLLGDASHTSIGVYANINRGTTHRTPDGWAKRAEAAVSDGYRAIKLAPFDTVRGGSTEARIANAHGGLDAFKAVREQIGVDAAVLLDCHWRFDSESALQLVRAVAPLSPYWIEAPILEDHENLEELQRIRLTASENGMFIAGGEFHLGPRVWAAFLRHGAYDVANPDVRFCGVDGMVRIAATAAEHGMAFSPHNHLGPIMTAVSLHIMAVAPTAQMLEQQYAESGVESCVVDPIPIEQRDGAIKVPHQSGLGVDIDTRRLAKVSLV